MKPPGYGVKKPTMTSAIFAAAKVRPVAVRRHAFGQGELRRAKPDRQSRETGVRLIDGRGGKRRGEGHSRFSPRRAADARGTLTRLA